MFSALIDHGIDNILVVFNSIVAITAGKSRSREILLYKYIGGDGEIGLQCINLGL